ncbi:MAG TPA: HNH endonuclease domain-containing protein [Candidatus Nitrosotenuis sp.]|nr:HNH endonuclease domain-containing protein [Candidatus Nitrosotenuis sp.]
MVILPEGEGVDPGRLARLFVNTTNSYKYLLFLALLDAVEASYDAAEVRVSRRQLALGMLEHAWYPHHYFRLSFGLQDRVGRILDSLGGPRFDFSQRGRALARAHLERTCSQGLVDELLRYVLQRLLRAFFEEDLRGCRESRVDRVLESLASSAYNQRVPLYRIDEAGIVVHPAWVAYLRRNLAVVRGWASWHWVTYMQSRNPNVPAVPEKLFPPLERAPLQEQTRYWRAVMNSTEIRCLYTGAVLEPGTAALDHFLPWSFVAHDRLWNLVPVHRKANSSKGDRLPHRRYLKGLLEVQVAGLLHARGRVPGWSRLVEPYVADLKLPLPVLNSGERTLLEPALNEAYSRTLPALMDLAEQLGFSPGWTWKD